MFDLKNWLHTTILASGVVISSFDLGLAQDMRPLIEVAPNSPPAYGATRCAALYSSIVMWTGEERLGRESFAIWEDAVDELLVFAAMQAVASGQSENVQQITEMVMRSTNTITGLYISRFEVNYTTTGTAFGQDTLLASDLEFCTALSQAASTALARTQSQ